MGDEQGADRLRLPPRRRRLRSRLGTRIYVDGVVKATPGPLPNSLASPHDFQIGGTSADAGGFDQFFGKLDEVAVYPHALSAARVRAHHRAGIDGVRSTYKDDVLADGPGSYWRLGEIVGTGWAIDRSGYAFHGKYGEHTETGVPGALAHDADTAVRFHGSDDNCYVRVESIFLDDPDRLDFGRDDFSAEAWVQTSVHEERVVLGKSTGSKPHWFLTVTDDDGREGRIRVKFENGVDPDRVFYGPAIRVDDGGWHHVLAVFDRDWGARIYVDGVEAATPGPMAGDITNGAPLEIGDTEGYLPFKGSLDEVAIYPRALTAQRARAHHATGSLGSGYADAVYADAPRGYWRLGEPKDWQVVHDIGENEVDGRTHGPRFGGDGVLLGDPDTSAAFDGGEDSIGVGDHYDFAGNQPFTLEAWMRPAKVDGHFRVLMCKHGYVNDQRQGWLLWHHETWGTSGTGKGYVGFERFRDGTAGLGTPGDLIQVGRWSHVAATYDGEWLRIYIDGEEVAQRDGQTAGLLDTDFSLSIGQCSWDGSQFEGDLDDVAIYERALTPKEVGEHYDAGVGESVEVTGTVSVTANASDDEGVTKVEFYDGDKRFATDTTAPYEAQWDTFRQDQPAYDGPHSLTTRAYDASDNVTTSTPLRATVVNADGTKFEATYESTGIPHSLTYEPGASAQDRHAVDVTVTNTSDFTWGSNELALAYQWRDATTQALVASGTVDTPSGAPIPSGSSRTLSLEVEPISPPAGVNRAQYLLRIDLVDRAPAPDAWFAAKGTRPVEQLVTITKQLAIGLGLERFYHYEGEDVGGGMQHLVNVASGNSLLRFSPFVSPGRGLSTVLDLTYNSLEGASESPVGNGWSLSTSTLSRLGCCSPSPPTGWRCGSSTATAPSTGSRRASRPAAASTGRSRPASTSTSGSTRRPTPRAPGRSRGPTA